MNMAHEMQEHLAKEIIPFWKRVKDEENGGFYGYVVADLKAEKKR